MLSINAFAEDWYLSDYINHFEGYENIIHENVILTQSVNNAHIDITDSMYIENHGIINGHLFAIDDYSVSINNMGTINGAVTAPNVTWIISSEDAINNTFDINSQNFSVTVQDIMAGANFDHGISLNQLQNLNANSFNITNSAIIIDNYSDWQNWDANVSLSQATLIINDFSDLVSGQIINHVTNQLDVSAIILNGAQGTYSIELVGQNTVILNVTPISSGENNLFTMPVISNTSQNNTGLSYRFNPSILMRPIKNCFYDKHTDLQLQIEIYKRESIMDHCINIQSNVQKQLCYYVGYHDNKENFFLPKSEKKCNSDF